MTSEAGISQIEGKLGITPRERYLQRTDEVENYFHKVPLGRHDKELPDGARVKVVLGMHHLSEIVKKPHTGRKRVTIFIPGIFHADQSESPQINDPLEIKLAASLLTGDDDSIMVLKPEGTNNQAYVDSQLNVVTQNKISRVSLDILREKLHQENISFDDCSFRIVGYSEGSTQGISLAARILEAKGTVAELVSIGGFGIVGDEKPISLPAILARVLENIKKANSISPLRPNFPPDHPFEQKGNDVIVAKELLGDKKQGGFEGSLKPVKIPMWQDAKILTSWALRFLGSQLFGLAGVPVERIQAALSKNPGSDVLTKVPTKVFIPMEDQYYPYEEIKKAVADLRARGGTIVTVASDVGHEFPHQNPSGVAYALEIFSRACQINSSARGG